MTPMTLSGFRETTVLPPPFISSSTPTTSDSKACGRSASNDATTSPDFYDAVVMRYLDCGLFESGFARRTWRCYGGFLDGASRVS